MLSKSIPQTNAETDTDHVCFVIHHGRWKIQTAITCRPPTQPRVLDQAFLDIWSHLGQVLAGLLQTESPKKRILGSLPYLVTHFGAVNPILFLLWTDSAKNHIFYSMPYLVTHFGLSGALNTKIRNTTIEGASVLI